MTKADVRDPRFAALIHLLRRTGMVTFQIRYQDDEEPTVWLAVGEWRCDEEGHPTPAGEVAHHEAAAALSPWNALSRLADQMVDGATCTHCLRPSGVTDDWRASMPLANVVCWYVFDPELQVYRRSCEGSAAAIAAQKDIELKGSDESHEE